MGYMKGAAASLPASIILVVTGRIIDAAAILGLVQIYFVSRRH